MTTDEIKLLLDYQKYELINFMKEFFDPAEPEVQERKWLKSTDVCEQLSCSPSTLCRMRAEGIIQYSLVQGTYYYQQSDVDQMMDGGRGK